MLTKKQMIERAKARLSSGIENALGFQIDIDTLTGIKAKVTSQKFFEVAPSKYLPVIVGENAFSSQILTYKDYSIGDDFETGIMDSKSNKSRMDKMDTAIEGVTVPVVSWAKGIEYNLLELGEVARAGNWSVVEAKERSRFKNYQLGIQKIAFLGLVSRQDVDGLLTQSDVSSNTTTIPAFIKSMTTTQLGTLVENLLSDYFSNSNNTAMPTHFVLPTNDYLGLAAPTSETYWNGSKLSWLTNMFREITANPDFKVLPLPYAQKALNSDFLGSGSGLNRYCLYRYDDESLRMDIPIDYTTTLTDTINGFNYESAAYAQFTGAKAYRPLEMLYFDHSA